MRKRRESTRVDGARRGERLLALVAIGFLAFNFPLLGLLGAGGTLFGIPAPFVYLYVAWATFIALVAVCLGTGNGRAPVSKSKAERDA